MHFKNIVALFTALALTLPTAAIAADKDTGKSAPTVSGERLGDLRIIVLQGEGAINNMVTHAGIAPIVEVRDRNDRPLDGASVRFELPPTGTSAAFPAEQLTYTGRTNRQGQVGAPALMPNHQAGRFSINVTAMLGNSVGYAKIRQTNSDRVVAGVTTTAHKSNTWKWLAVVGAGALVGGIVVATHGSSNTATVVPPTTITLSPGPISVGTPH